MSCGLWQCGLPFSHSLPLCISLLSLILPLPSHSFSHSFSPAETQNTKYYCTVRPPLHLHLLLLLLRLLLFPDCALFAQFPRFRRFKQKYGQGGELATSLLLRSLSSCTPYYGAGGGAATLKAADVGAAAGAGAGAGAPAALNVSLALPGAYYGTAASAAQTPHFPTGAGAGAAAGAAVPWTHSAGAYYGTVASAARHSHYPTGAGAGAAAGIAVPLTPPAGAYYGAGASVGGALPGAGAGALTPQALAVPHGRGEASRRL